MITLRADNRTLTQNAKYSYLIDNYASGSASIYVTNTDGFSVGSFVLIGEFGQESSEIFRIGSVSSSTGQIGLLNASGSGDSTTFAHPESTKVYVIPYNQVRFYWTAATGTISDETPTFANTTPLTGYTDLDPTSWYTVYNDEGHSTGFGWFLYYNSVSTISSQNSNPIPYAGFSVNTVAQVFGDFDSLLNVNEIKLVTITDKFAWLNEALAVLKNKLNLTNIEYLVSTEQSLSIVAGTSEYQLPADFADLVSIYDTTSWAAPIPFISLSKIGSYTGDTTFYYIRNRYIGFVPTPETSTTYKYRYRAKSTAATSLSTYIDLPDNAFYTLKDWMMYRACMKFNNPMAKMYYESFSNSVNLYMQSAVKRDANLDSWSAAPEANV